MIVKDFPTFLTEQKQQIDQLLPTYIEHLQAPEVLKEAMLYSVAAGGKRLRPVLFAATMEALGRDSTAGQPVACALEMIHTYSLIHDDLPAMDDDDLRRGKPTNHKVFGEAVAILAGDGLLTYSFETIAQLEGSEITAEVKLNLIAKLAKAAGVEGMVGGQTDDLKAEGRSLTTNELAHIHHCKTGALLVYAVEAGAMLGQATETQIRLLKSFAKHVGLAFQIRDDILDIEGTSENMGKTPGSDETKKKSTYPQLLTMNGAKEKLHYHLLEAKTSLYEAKVNHQILEQLTDYIATRDR